MVGAPMDDAGRRSLPLDRAKAAYARALAALLRDPFRTLVALILPIAAAPRIGQMLFDQGVFWPDEIHQTIEQGHRLAFGYGWIPWEFRDGARSWVFPGIVGVWLKMLSFVGLTSSGVGVVMSVRVLMLGVALAGVYGAMRVGRVAGGLLGAFLAGAITALCPPLLVYGTRCMTEMASGPLLVLAAALVLEPDPTERRAGIAAALAGISIFFRYQNGLFAVAFCLILLVRRAWKAAAMFALVGVIIGCLGGVLDWITWGKPFHSFVVYVKFNLIEGKAAKWGVESNVYFLQITRSAFGPGLWIVVVGYLLSLARMRILPIVCVLNLVIHSAIPHKEYRFLMPMFPIALALAGGGLGWLLGGLLARDPLPTARFARIRARAGGWVAPVIAIALALLFVRRTQTITFGAMGQDIKGRDDGYGPWNHEAGPNYALWEAGKHDDICGVAVVGTPLVSIGGYSYLHKNVPMLGSLSSYDLAAANYVVAPKLMLPPPGYTVVKGFRVPIYVGTRTDAKKNTAPDWDYVLFRRDGGCTPAPAWWVPHLS
jgi:GPI mannosyltransferase 3